MSDIKISIVLPVYNGEKYLSQSIESCLNQTHRNLELIIVNDCSTDGTLSIAEQYADKDKRVKIVNNLENKKLPSSLNIGHKEANGDFITWTSDDNFYELNALEVLLNEITEKKADVIYSDFVLIEENGNEVREVKYPGIENIIFGNFIGCCFLYKKEVYQKNNGYNEDLFLVEDYDFWLRAILHSRFFHVKKALYKYRKHGDSLTNQIGSNSKNRNLWEENINKMYVNFCKMILGSDSIEIPNFLSNNLTNQRIDFESFVENDIAIKNFKRKLKQNQNFTNGKLIEKVFLAKIIDAMIVDRNYKNNFFNSLFIVKRYGKVISKNDIKTLIKYSFLNKKN